VLAWLRQPLTSYLISLLGSHDQAEDVAQEAFCRLWEARIRLRPDGSLRGFVYQVARNLAIAEQRRLRVHHRAAELLRADSLPHVTYDPPADSEHPHLMHAVRHLPMRRREIVILHAVHGLSYKEIGQLMGIAPQTVANQFSSALATLRRALGP
jgi:RNA polymerase sigma-70 factor (ECF subfamily)